MKERTISDLKIKLALSEFGFTHTIREGRLMLMELLAKAGAGYMNSHTEGLFLIKFGLLKIDRTPNKKGRQFLCSMVYTHSNGRPEAYELMKDYRTDNS